MNSNPEMPTTEKRPSMTAGIATRVGTVAFFIILQGVILFVAAGRLTSTAVRIQSDRGQTVCRSGPYRFVRHPGYVGFVLQSLGTSLLLGSLWALIPGCTAAVLMVIRTAFEDRFLQVELPGYREYTQQVRYRLVPGVW